MGKGEPYIRFTGQDRGATWANRGRLSGKNGEPVEMTEDSLMVTRHGRTTGTGDMELGQLLRHLEKGLPVEAGTDAHACMVTYSNEAMRITAELNGSYHTPEEIRRFVSTLTGKQVDASLTVFPPLYSDFGKNLTIGKNVFINSGCRFQDQGGITIGDGAFIGHMVVFATINHGFLPEERGHIHPAPIVIGRNVWIGAHATILPGVTIGDNAIVAAGAVVSRSVAPNTVVGGVPARFIRLIRLIKAIPGTTPPEQGAPSCNDSRLSPS